jgi:hypothetical protein
MRAPSAAGLLRVVGLAGTATGCVLAVAALSSPWAVDGPERGVAPDESGWTFMAYGDLALVAVCALVVILAIALCVGPRSRRVSRSAGAGAIALLLAALGGVAVMWWLTGLDASTLVDEDDVRRFDPGPGFSQAATGLLVAITGTVVLLAGRWETRTRRALAREAPPAEPTWLSAPP